MNVVHINTQDVGGAAIAAYRLHTGLIDNGIDSKFLVLYGSGRYPDINIFSPSRRSFVLRKMKYRVFGNPGRRIQKLLSKKKNIEMFSSPDTLYDLTTSRIVKNADIIHLHWVSNFLDYDTFFKTIRKPIIWSFHDENPFMGGCHYSNDSSLLSRELQEKEKVFLNRKMSALRQLSELKIICPSDWMQRRVRGSFYNRFKSKTVFYGLGDNEFIHIERAVARQRLNLTAESIVMCAVAADLKNYRKGFDIIFELMDFFSKNKIYLLLVGEPPEVELPNNVIQLGKLSDPHSLNLVYSASDALLFPSRQDNLPNVLIESLYCGTPVLGFSVGGVPEIIQNEVNGLLASEVSVESFGNLVIQFLKKKDAFKRKAIRSSAIQKFSLQNQINLVTNLYRESINISDASS